MFPLVSLRKAMKWHVMGEKLRNLSIPTVHKTKRRNDILTIDLVLPGGYAFHKFSQNVTSFHKFSQHENRYKIVKAGEKC